MDISYLLNEKITHKAFGAGLVEKVDEGFVEVYFEGSDKKCKFSYPSCFRNFMSINNVELKGKVEEDLSKWLVDSGTLEKEKTMGITLKRQKGITKREKERERLRIEKARAAKRTRPIT